MAALAWLIIPVAAALLAMMWAGWAARKPKATGDPASLAEHERFKAAMARSTATGGSPTATAGATASGNRTRS